ncbi:hypothetical protein REPUB_Repub11eG0064400 [Reevesia pubescens]
MEESEIDIEEYDSNDDFMDDIIDEPCILLSKVEKKMIRSPWRNTLIVKLLGMSIGYNYMCNRVKKIWYLVGDFHAVDLEDGFHCFKFSNETYFSHVLLRGPWMIADHYLIIRRWTLGFRFEDATITSVAAWIRFLGMPLEYYDYEILKRMGNLLGQTLMIDRNTLMTFRGRYARICAEINLIKPLVPRIFIGGWWQNVEYEGLRMDAKNKVVENMKVNDLVPSIENDVEKYEGIQKKRPRNEEARKVRQGKNMYGSHYDVLTEEVEDQDVMEFVPSSVEPIQQTNSHVKFKSKSPKSNIEGFKCGLQLGRTVKDKPPDIFLDHEMNDILILDNKCTKFGVVSKDVGDRELEDLQSEGHKPNV